MVKKRIIVIATILILLAVSAGCGGKATQTAATTPATQTTPTAEKTTTAPPTTTATSKPTTTQKPTTTTTTVVEIQPTETQEPKPTETQEPEPTETPEPEPVVFTFTSSAFGYSEPMPRQYSYYGGNKSPALEWSGAPEGTVSFALIMEDPDGQMWSHWVVFNIPSDVLGLAEGIPTTPTLASGALQGRNDFGGMG